MDLHLNGKTALVTGASAGIGRAIALGLAREGVKVCITARRRELLEDLAKEMVGVGGPAPAIVVADFLKEGAPQQLARDALGALGQINILMNCAGAGGQTELDAPEEHWARSMFLNYTHVRQLSHAILPDMISHQWGRIINITGKSESLKLGAAHPAKAAVHAWAKDISTEAGKYGITVNCIAPGRIMSEQVRRNYTEEFRREHAAKDIPVGRYGEPEELACLAVFLASPIASYISGAVMPVDGGLRRYAF
ncbi:MAG: SDR family oxidoreductase [Betaproteobacteria bacterium]|nr:SDR family oxidoreductase [Betaproteobacteria bacterium]